MTTYADSFANINTKLGTSKDKSSGGRIFDRGRLQCEALEVLYEQSALSARIIDRLVDDATREGFDLTSEESFDFAQTKTELKNIQALENMADAWRWARLYGGAILVPITDDGRKLEEPLVLEDVNHIQSLQVLESPDVIPQQFDPGLGQRAFRRPRFYNITANIPGRDRSESRKIHWSRVIRFDGVKISPRRLAENNGWGPSVLDRILTEIQQLAESMKYAHNTLHEVSVMVLRIDGLRKKLAAGGKEKSDIGDAVAQMREMIDNLHTLAIDKNDEYVEVKRTVAGIADLTKLFIDALVRATDMPRTVLLGEQPGGLSANADSEIRAWFDFVRAQQQKTLTPAMNRLLEIQFAAMRNRNLEVPMEWTIKWTRLWQPTEKEQAETNKTQAEADAIHMEFGVTTNREVRERLIRDEELDPLPPEEGGLEDLDSEPTSPARGPEDRQRGEAG